jgi:hypothetical protein
MAFFNSIGLAGVDAAAVEVLPERTLPTGVDALLPLPPATDDELALDVGVDRPTVEDGFGGKPSLFFPATEELFAGLGAGAVRIVVAVILSGGRPPTAGGLPAVAVDPVGGILNEVVVLSVALLAAPVAAGAVERRDGVSGLDAGEPLVFGVEAGADVLVVAVVVVVALGLAVGVDGPDFVPAAGLVAVLVVVGVAGAATGVELRVVRLAVIVGVALLVPELAVAAAATVVLAGVVRMVVVVLAEAVARLAAAAAASAVLAAEAALALLAATIAAVAALLAAADVAVVDGAVVADAGVSRVPAMVVCWTLYVGWRLCCVCSD